MRKILTLLLTVLLVTTVSTFKVSADGTLVVDQDTTLENYDFFNIVNVKNGATLTIAGNIEVEELNIENGGKVEIAHSSDTKPFSLKVNASLTVNTGGSLVYKDDTGTNGVLDIEAGVLVTGLKLWHRGDDPGDPSDDYEVLTSTGSLINGSAFSYDTTQSKWYRDEIRPLDRVIDEATDINDYTYFGTLTINAELFINSFIEVNNLIVNDGGSITINGTAGPSEPNGLHIYNDGQNDGSVYFGETTYFVADNGHVLDIEPGTQVFGLELWQRGDCYENDTIINDEGHSTMRNGSVFSYDGTNYRWYRDEIRPLDLTITESTEITDYILFDNLTVSSELIVKNFIDVNDLMITDGGSIVIDSENEEQPAGIHIFNFMKDDDPPTIDDAGSITLDGDATLKGNNFHYLEIDKGTELTNININKYFKPMTTPLSENVLCSYDGFEWNVQTDFMRFAEEINNRMWAYYVTNPTTAVAKDTIKNYLAINIFNYFVFNQNEDEIKEYSYLFTDLTKKEDFTEDKQNEIIASIKNMIDLSNLSDKNDDGNLVLKDETKLQYYEFVLNYTDGGSLTQQVFLIDGDNTNKEQERSFIFSYLDSDEERIFVKCRAEDYLTYSKYLTVPVLAHEYYVFGNGIGDAGQTRMADGQTDKYHVALQLVTKDSNVHTTTDKDEKPVGIACTLVVYKENFLGIHVAAPNYAAAWAFRNFPTYSVNDPAVATVFYNNNSIDITNPENSPSTITNIVFYNGLKTMNESTITDDGAGKYTVTFGSIFFDTLKIRIFYSNGTSKIATINRVGLNIDEGVKDNKVQVWHGTDKVSEYATSCSEAIYATYYYTSMPTNRVKLFVTLTYEDGSKETKIVSPANASVIDGTEATGEHWQGTDGKYGDDFILWEGNDNMPVKAEAIVYKESSNPDESFGGAILGSGTGVSWIKKVEE